MPYYHLLLISAVISLTFPLYGEEKAVDPIERVTTIAPFPRGLVMLDKRLFVLCRGRVRGAGGVSNEVEDQAGTIYVVDPNKTEKASLPLSEEIKNNGKVFALPSSPPFLLWDRHSQPPERDRWTDRPYCTLRYHRQSQNFFICGYSGIDKPKKPGQTSFSKNLTDVIFRYDLRTKSWQVVERHNIEAGGSYPHHDVSVASPPHGWLNGPDNILPLGKQLYAVAKDNNLLVRYELDEIIDNPQAAAPLSHKVLGKKVRIKGQGQQVLFGQSALAYHDGWLYLGYRTSSVILRLRLDKNFVPILPIRAELVARFQPYDPCTKKSANITDMDFDEKGRLYVVSAKPSAIHRFTPDPQKVYDGRKAQPWLDAAKETNNPYMKTENLLYHQNYLYFTSGDGYSYQQGAWGTVYRIRVE